MSYQLGNTGVTYYPRRLVENAQNLLPAGYKPKLGNKVRAKGGWRLQTLNLGYYRNLQRGYVKIFDPEGNYVDSALNVANARKRVDYYIRTGYPLMHVKLKE